MQRKGRGQGRGQIRCREGVEQVQNRAGQGRSKWAAKVGQVWGGRGAWGRRGVEQGGTGAEQVQSRERRGAEKGQDRGGASGQIRGRKGEPTPVILQVLLFVLFCKSGHLCAQDG